jgi:glutamine amidotransferase
MCRILLVRADARFDPRPHLRAVARIARDSREYQGHGWGCAWRGGDGWHLYHHIQPIWEDPACDGGDTVPATTALLVHARSAFRDEGIAVENNMPFADAQRVFIFNGELRGVRIKEQGRIGAEKIFNYIKRFDDGDLAEAVRRGTRVIHRRSRYVRAMNIVMANAREAVASCHFGEDPDYFTLRFTQRDGLDIVCSEPYPGETGWRDMNNGETRALSLQGTGR